MVRQRGGAAPWGRGLRAFRHSCALFPSFLRRQEPARAPTQPSPLLPSPNSSLPVIPASFVIPAQAGMGAHPLNRHSCAGRNRAHPPNPPPLSPSPIHPSPAIPASSVIPAQAGMGALTHPSHPSSSPSPIHLSPLSGGRLRGGSAVRAVPACAGMTGRGGAGTTGEGGRRQGRRSGLGAALLVASHPPPNLPPKRGEG